MTKRIQIVCESETRRLDVFVAENSGLTRSHAQKLIAQGAVSVNDVVATKVSAPVKEDSVVTCVLPPDIPLNVVAEDIPLDVVYEDGDLAVINKAQGMTVHPANNVHTGTLVNALLFRLKDLSGINGVLRPGIVHRLDKDTSGLLVVAKNDATHVALQQQIQSKTCRRIYLALLEGNLKQDSGFVDQPIGRCKSDRKKMDVVADGRNALTYYTVLQRFKGYTLAQFELKTGRTHQIRVHAKFLGHPVVGDKTYGYKTCPFNLQGQLLHAQNLQFTHPTSGKQQSFFAPLPPYFEQIVNKLRKQTGGAQ